jgi:hypothetical protein
MIVLSGANAADLAWAVCVSLMSRVFVWAVVAWLGICIIVQGGAVQVEMQFIIWWCRTGGNAVHYLVVQYRWKCSSFFATSFCDLRLALILYWIPDSCNVIRILPLCFLFCFLAYALAHPVCFATCDEWWNGAINATLPERPQALSLGRQC